MMNRVETRFIFETPDKGFIKFVVLANVAMTVPGAIKQEAVEVKTRQYQPDGTYKDTLVKQARVEAQALLDREWIEPDSFFFEQLGLINALMFDLRVRPHLREAMVRHHTNHISTLHHCLARRISVNRDHQVKSVYDDLQKYCDYIGVLTARDMHRLPELPLLKSDLNIQEGSCNEC